MKTEELCGGARDCISDRLLTAVAVTGQWSNQATKGRARPALLPLSWMKLPQGKDCGLSLFLEKSTLKAEEKLPEGGRRQAKWEMCLLLFLYLYSLEC